MFNSSNIHRTLVVLDCGESLTDSGKDVVFSWKKLNSDGMETFRCSKSAMSYCVEAIVEHSRILMDILSTQFQISVFSATSNGMVRHNNWSYKQQSALKIIQGFENVYCAKNTFFAKSICDSNLPGVNSHNVISSLYETHDIPNEQQYLVSNKYAYTSNRVKCTVLCLLPSKHTKLDFNYYDDAGNPIFDIPDKIFSQMRNNNENASSNSQIVDECELLIIKMDDKVPKTQHTTKQISAKFRSTVFVVKPSSLYSLMLDLAVCNYNIKAAKISGIPMREKDAPENTRSYYDVALLYSEGGSQPQEYPQNIGGGGLLREVSLRWRSIDRKTNPDVMQTIQAHRISPLDANSPSTASMMKHVFSGKPVTLVTVPADATDFPAGPIPSTSSIPISHLLLAHGECLYLHKLSPLNNNFQISEFPINVYSQDINNYRVKDFVALMEENLLRQPKPGQPIPQIRPIDSGGLATPQVERATRYFPLLESDTLIFSRDQAQDLRNLLDPVKEFFLRSTVQADDLETCTALITRFYQLASQNEVRMFPSLSDRTLARFEAYKKAWGELYKFLRAHSQTKEHQQILTLMQRLWKDPLQETPSAITKTPSIPTTPIKTDITPISTPLASSNYEHTAVLYSHLNKAQTSSSSGNLDNVWDQVDQAMKDVDEQQWKQKDESQKPAMEFNHMQNSRGPLSSGPTSSLSIASLMSELPSSVMLHQTPQQQQQQQQIPTASVSAPSFVPDREKQERERVAKRKRANLDEILDTCDSKSLFFQYWNTVQTKFKPLEFEGRMTEPQ